MGDNDKADDIDLFEQLDEALEEREGKDRRQANSGSGCDGEDRRQNDRRGPLSK